uniref:NADH-ubiquinone oxidoreductase 75 kDa subunit n=1 Tax=Heterostelium pallidum TaxID=13642 RepID=Q5ILJ9_HETPA|nr:NADH dehydrogenase subunit 11 [Heterostelium pallidum]AAU00611.1 NADH dehydrogenase subunit 11 [Heterostelium pallidum]
MINFKINEIEYEIDEKKEDLTILQACLKFGIEIPRFCYHEKLTIAGNCRMCLVYVTNNEKLVAACGIPLDQDFDDESICTEVDEILRAREGVMEFLLINHPLDCPICDQGGECDLQDQTMLYGLDTGRFYMNKRAVEVKNFGLLIKAIMTRCIHCTRCVRFLTEVAGINDLGVLGRGYKMEIGTYIQNNTVLNSEVSGNIIDLCPVGALTSQMYAFKGRPWELKNIPGVDVFDPLLSSINFQVKGAAIMRILPKINDELNEEWLTDKMRFHYDSYKVMNETRLNFPKLKLKNNKYITLDWKNAIKLFFNLIFLYKNMNVIFGSKISYDILAFYKVFLNNLGLKNYITENNLMINNFNYDFRENYLNTNLFMNIEKHDLLFLIGLNLRLESPLLNIRLRSLNFNENQDLNKKIVILGNKFFWKKDSQYLGSKLNTLLNILEGRHSFCKQLIQSKNPLIFVGSSVSLKTNINIGRLKTFFSDYLKIKKENIMYFLNGVNNVAAMELGIFTSNFQNKKSDLIYLIDSNEFKIQNKNAFIIYQGILNSYLQNNINLYLPSKFYFEEKAEYLNLFGNLCESQAFNYSIKNTIKGHKIISSVLLYLIKYNKTIDILNSRAVFNYYNLNKFNNKEIKINKYLTLNNIVSDYYTSDIIIRNSMKLQAHRKMINDFKNNFKNDN